jgi:hypothetical protein
MEGRRKASEKRDCSAGIGTASYLMALSRLCLEVIDNPRLLPVFIGIILRVPATVAELIRAERTRIAA